MTKLREGIKMKAHIREKLATAQDKVYASQTVTISAGNRMTERHFTFTELASLWSLSYETTRRLFLTEPGVVPFGDTYRVPESVARQVYARLANH
jgi:hypothetical protein